MQRVVSTRQSYQQNPSVLHQLVKFLAFTVIPELLKWE